MELLYRLLLLGYPREFRAEYGAVMLEMFRAQRRRCRRDASTLPRLRFCLFTLDDLARNITAERSARWRQRPPSPITTGRNGRGHLPTDGFETMQTILRELRHAARRLLRAPVFTATAVAIIGLGVGANTAMFSFVDAVLLRPQPFANAAELVNIYQDSDDGQPSSNSFPAHLDIATHKQIFAGAAAVMSWGVAMNTDEGMQQLSAEFVTANYFPTLGLQPHLGRNFEPTDDVDGAEPLAIIGHAMWQGRFGADPNIVGTRIRLNGSPMTIIGVGPAGYGGIMPGFTRDIWLSLSAIRGAVGDWAAPTLESRSNHWFMTKARLASGITVQQAQAAMDALATRLADEFPQYNEGRKITVFGPDEIRLHPAADAQLLPLSAALMTVVALVLLIACSNLANLMLVRGSARTHDVSIRMALGASRGRILWHAMSESLVLSLLGGAVGLALAFWATRAFVAADLPLPFPAPLDLRVDTTVFAFTAALSLATGLLLGLLPGFRIARSDVVTSLRDEGSMLAGSGGKFRLPNLLVVGQVAVSFLLLAAAGLFVRSLGNAESADLGFDSGRIAVIATDTAYAGHDAASGILLLDQLRERVAALPAVEAAALTGRLPVNGNGSSTLVIDGYTPATGTNAVEVARSSVGPHYFRALQIPLLHGRDFEADDTTSGANVSIISEAMARAYWGKSDAVGERFRGQGSEDWIEVIGVAGNVKVSEVTEPPTPLFYVPLGDATFAYVVARTNGSPGAILAAMRDQLHQVDPELSVVRLQSFDAYVAAALILPRLSARMLGGFGALGLGIACLGMYAVVAGAVERRSTEVGIRMALGAEHGQVITMVLREVMVLVAVAIVLGIGLAWFALPPVAGILYGVSAVDPASLLVAAVLLVGTALVASWIPARRAATIDPVVALRQE